MNDTKKFVVEFGEKKEFFTFREAADYVISQKFTWVTANMLKSWIDFNAKQYILEK
jgi:hypothetical protein